MGGWEEVGTIDGGGKVTQERMTDADAARVTAKKGEFFSKSDENKVDEKRESEKPCTVVINNPPSASSRHLDHLTSGKYGGTGEGGALVMQERITEADVAKVDANAKADAPDASGGSKIDTPNIDVKRGIL